VPKADGMRLRVPRRASSHKFGRDCLKLAPACTQLAVGFIGPV
jgi:hypothetical protein